MLFQNLDRIKRSVVMTTIVLMFIGLVFFMLPVSYIPFVGRALGFLLLVAGTIAIMNFINSSKALVHYIKLSGGLLAGLFGIILFAIDGFFISFLSWFVGTVPIIMGVYGIYHALAFARRSGRKGWWVLIVLSCLLLLFGTINFTNPWEGSLNAVMKVIGGTMTYSALVSALSLIWIWPFHKEEA